MAKLPKTDQRKKTTKLIDKLCAINLMKANMNSKTNNPNYSKVKSLIGIGRNPEMEDILDAWAKGLRDAGCCVNGSTLKVKALQILREDLNVKVEFTASDGWLRGLLTRKNYIRFPFIFIFKKSFNSNKLQKKVRLIMTR